MSKPRQHLINRRKDLGMSQVELADAVGVTQQQISRLEKGIRKLHLEWVEKLAVALKLTPNEVIYGSSGEKLIRKIGVLVGAETVEKLNEDEVDLEICPAWLASGEDLKLIEVVTDILEPRLYKGDRLYFEAACSDPSEAIDHECLAVLPDQTMVVRRVERRQDGPGILLRGYRSGTPILFPAIGTQLYRLVGIKPKG